MKNETGIMFGQWCSHEETDKTEVKSTQLRGQGMWGWVKFGLACSLTMGQVGTDGIATICEPIVATAISMDKNNTGNMLGMDSDIGKSYGSGEERANRKYNDMDWTKH